MREVVELRCPVCGSMRERQADGSLDCYTCVPISDSPDWYALCVCNR